MAVLKYKDQQGNWQTLDTGSGSVSSVEITSLPYGSEPTARISAGVLYIGWPDGVPVDSVITDESDNPVTSAAIYQALQDTPGMAPVQSVNGQTGAVVLDAQDVGAYEKPASGIPASDLADGVIPSVPVQDVQVNGVSVLQDGVANVPKATSSGLGVVRGGTVGVGINNDGQIFLSAASDALIKNGTNTSAPIVPNKQHAATFYGLCKAAGADMASSSNPVGQYTDAAKVAIQKMLGIYEAPWELIREDTVTNATEADIDITVDGNGEAFELTDVLMVLIVPTHSEDTTIGDYGRIYLYNNTTEIRRLYLLNAASKLVQANSVPQIAIGRMLNDNGLMSIDFYQWSAQSNRTNLQIVPNSDSNGISTPFAINTSCISKVKIGEITGKLQYRLYGKRKWQ